MRYSLLFLLVVLYGCGDSGYSTSIENLTWEEFYASEFFTRVQMEALFPDSKTFTDYVPKEPLGLIIASYGTEKDLEEFDLMTFVERHFDPPQEKMSGFSSDTARSVREHIEILWPYLTR